MNGNMAKSYGKPLEGGGGTVCQNISSRLWLYPGRNQFPYASCADISGSGRLFRARNGVYPIPANSITFHSERRTKYGLL